MKFKKNEMTIGMSSSGNTGLVALRTAVTLSNAGAEDNPQLAVSRLLSAVLELNAQLIQRKLSLAQNLIKCNMCIL